MASRNAKHLILLSRSGVKTKAAQLLMDELKTGGVSAKAPICDVSDMASLASVLAECNKEMPPIKGCIQGSMVLKVWTVSPHLNTFRQLLMPFTGCDLRQNVSRRI